MKTLSECRVELNSVDDQMKKLFLKRMSIIKEVSAYKKANGIATYDPERERSMKERLSADIDEPMKTLYLQFLDSILAISKEYQFEDR